MLFFSGRKIIYSLVNCTHLVEEIADATYLSMYEIETIRNLDLSLSPKLEMARDLLVLGCLMGLRFSDFSNI